MKSDIIIIGGGAAGLMAAYGAAKANPEAKIVILEKMPRPGRKILFTGKGRCNFTNVKPWNEFSQHIRTNPNFVKPAFFSWTPDDMMDFLEVNGTETVVERGDRAFPYSHRASEVLDTMVDAVLRAGAMLLTEKEVESVSYGFTVKCTDGEIFQCRKLIIATGGLSYPMTGSTGDGYGWAREFKHDVTPLFPSLTALVPKGYKVLGQQDGQLKGHIHRETPMTASAEALKGAKLKNVSLSVTVDGKTETEFGDIDFTDGGIEGPIGFQVSRRCVKALMNGSRITFSLDLKPGVPVEELAERIKTLWNEIKDDPRSRQWKGGRGINGKEMYRILLGKLMPWELIPGFQAWNGEILKTEMKKSEYQGRSRRPQRRAYNVDLNLLAKTLKDWKFEIIGFVGYERCVITAGGVNTEEVLPKTMESRLVPGLYFCGEVLDMDCDTGGYNLQCAFSTGRLAGESAAKSL